MPDRAVQPEASPPRGPFGLPAPVWLLGLTSLFTDTASEAIYPLLPLFLTHVLHAGAVSLGIIEGVAEAANSILKIVSGRLSDRWQVRRPIVIAGYTLSSLARPVIGLVTTWPQVLAIRFVDRVGKGVRGAPRDAWLAAYARRETRGRIFGFHRAMDHVGAILGPSLAALFLLAYPGQYRRLFLLTVVPGALAVATLFLLADTRARVAAPIAGGGAPGPETRPARLGRPFSVFLLVLVLFTFGNSTDAFLLLRLSDLGMAPMWVPLVWALLHVVKAAVSVYGGALSDRLGRRAIIGAGWIVYAVVYAGFAMTESLSGLVAWFLVYGFYYGFAEGTEKALVADLVPPELRGTAFGYYNAVLGIGALVASVLFGVIWKLAGAPAAFGVGAAFAVLATMSLFALVPESAGRRGASG
jgi:MFS family permease